MQNRRVLSIFARADRDDGPEKERRLVVVMIGACLLDSWKLRRVLGVEYVETIIDGGCINADIANSSRERLQWRGCS